MKYTLTKYETIRRTEKVEYSVDIPENIKNKEKYANNQIAENKYKRCEVIDIVDSEILDEENVGLRATSPGVG